MRVTPLLCLGYAISEHPNVIYKLPYNHQRIIPSENHLSCEVHTIRRRPHFPEGNMNVTRTTPPSKGKLSGNHTNIWERSHHLRLTPSSGYHSIILRAQLSSWEHYIIIWRLLHWLRATLLFWGHSIIQSNINLRDIHSHLGATSS